MTSELQRVGRSRPGGDRLTLRNFSKTFGTTRALREVDLDLTGGEIHALCGQNGSGKSTIIKILSGYHGPDHGAGLKIDGQEVKLPMAPGHAEKLGIRFVHQDLGLAGELTVLDNLYIEDYPTTPIGTVRWPTARRLAKATLQRFQLDVSLDDRVDKLNPAQRTILAIARAMRREADGTTTTTRVLILDEPTAHLPAADVERMMTAVRAALHDDVAVLIVTHRLQEVLEYADRVTVLRDGARVASEPVTALDHDTLVELLLGRRLENQYPEIREQHGSPLLELHAFSTGKAYEVDLKLHEGEILGITGLLGAGFEDLPYGIFAAEPSTGELKLDGRTANLGRPSDAIDIGMALVPAERIGQAGVALATLAENLTLPSLKRRRLGPFIDGRRERNFTASVIERYDVRPPGRVDRPLSVLSGGNQQKLLMAKWLEANPKILLLHEPTQGVDIGSRRQLFDLVAAQAAKGAGVILASADYADLAHLCHRVLVFSRGRVVSELHGSALNEDRIAEICLRDQSITAS